jgi:aminopeptidase N
MQILNFPSHSPSGTITTVFEESPIMSPYLLAFIISDFDYSSMKLGRTTHRIYTRPDNDATLRTQFALTNSDLFLKELERFVSFRYELTKLDQAALPDFQSGLFIAIKKFKSFQCNAEICKQLRSFFIDL